MKYDKLNCLSHLAFYYNCFDRKNTDNKFKRNYNSKYKYNSNSKSRYRSTDKGKLSMDCIPEFLSTSIQASKKIKETENMFKNYLQNIRQIYQNCTFTPKINQSIEHKPSQISAEKSYFNAHPSKMKVIKSGSNPKEKNNINLIKIHNIPPKKAVKNKNDFIPKICNKQLFPQTTKNSKNKL